MRYLLLFFLLLPAHAAELELKARIEPSGPYHLGDSLRFVWDVSHDPRVRIDSDLAGPLAAALQSAGFEASSPPAATATGAHHDPLVPRVDVATATEPRTRLTLSAPVTTFTTGVHRVPSITVLYHDAAGARQSAQTPEMVVPVQSLLTSPTSEPRGVKPPIPYPSSLPILPLALLLLLLILVPWAIHRLRRPRPVPAPPPLPPDEEAFRRIDVLLAESHSPKEFCDRLSDILRHYLGRRFGLASMGDTSHELLSALAAAGHLTPEDLDRLRVFLEECDLAKFARHRPADTGLTALIESARDLVVRTRPPRSDAP